MNWFENDSEAVSENSNKAKYHCLPYFCEE